MKILFLTRKKSPEVGGVENHIRELTKSLEQRGCKVKTISRLDIKFPEIKFFGLLYIWNWFWNNRGIMFTSDIVHCHDVFIWYFPFCLIYPKKLAFTTVHGFEWNSFTKMSIFQKRLAVRLSNKTIGVGKFLEKYLNVKFDLITYGASTRHKGPFKKNKNTILYVGRLEENTGLLQFLKWLKVKGRGLKVEFCGDGNLRSECEKYGVVHGFTKPDKYYKTAEYCVPGGYLAALEALSYNCKLKLFWNNKIKEDYWKMSPFYKLEGEELKSWAKKQTWEKLANEYLDLYNSIK